MSVAACQDGRIVTQHLSSNAKCYASAQQIRCSHVSHVMLSHVTSAKLSGQFDPCGSVADRLAWHAPFKNQSLWVSLREESQYELPRLGGEKEDTWLATLGRWSQDFPFFKIHIGPFAT